MNISHAYNILNEEICITIILDDIPAYTGNRSQQNVNMFCKNVFKGAEKIIN